MVHGMPKTNLSYIPGFAQCAHRWRQCDINARLSLPNYVCICLPNLQMKGIDRATCSSSESFTVDTSLWNDQVYVQ